MSIKFTDVCPWGARSFQFKDPDGNILYFRSMTKEGA